MDGPGSHLSWRKSQYHPPLKPLFALQKMNGGPLSPVLWSKRLTRVCFCFREAPVQPQCSFPPTQPSQIHCRGREGQIPRLQVQHPAEGCQACSAFVCFKSISLKETRVLWIQFKLSTFPRGCMWSAPERSFLSPKPTSVDRLFSSLCYYQCVFIEFISLFISLRIRLSP